MKIMNFGSLNLDYVCQVDHFVRPGETLTAVSQMVSPGGKGLNQSVALARAGMKVLHAGCVGEGGGSLISLLQHEGADTGLIRNVSPVLQGNAMIQVNKEGENCIVLYGGSNRSVTPDQVVSTLDCLCAGDYLLLQNEISCMKEILKEAAERELFVILNPSPCDLSLEDCDFSAVRWLLVNELEAVQFCRMLLPAGDNPGRIDQQQDQDLCLDEVWNRIHRVYPQMSIVITLGSKGAVCYCPGLEKIIQPAFPAAATDTTGAGDTFTGYFAAGLAEGRPVGDCLRRASRAAAIAVTRPGAARAIPYLAEIASDGLA